MLPGHGLSRGEEKRGADDVQIRCGVLTRSASAAKEAVAGRAEETSPRTAVC